MKKLNILILYKNKKSKIIPFNKIKHGDLSSKDIETIFIPLYDNPNSYIPIKSSLLYNFDTVEVNIAYQAFIYDYEDEKGTSFDVQYYHSSCNNIIEFINSIYNCYKFRGVTLYLESSYQGDTAFSNFIISIRHINLKFYDKNHKLFEEIDSGELPDLMDYSRGIYRKTPPAYVCENRMNCLKDILYVPNDIDGIGEADVERLPLCIHLSNNTWKKIRKPGKELLSSEYILYRIRDFEIYYLMEYAMYLELLNLKGFDVFYICSPIDTSVGDDDYFISIDRGRIPPPYEKSEIFDLYMAGEIYNIMNAQTQIVTPDSFIETIIFFNTIMNYIKYYGQYCYSGNITAFKVRTFAILARYCPCGEYQDEQLLTELETDYDTVSEAFLKMFLEGR